MSQAGAAHSRYHELLSGRLDGSLTHAEADELARHLAGCPRCRQAERAYREQRLRLRSLRTVAPPRDMWARTSAALDREVARSGRRRLRRRRSRTLAGGAAVASVAALGLSLALIADGIAPAVITSPGASVGLLARATPFTIPSEALAFLGSGAEGLSIYRTHVDHVCPATAIDCLDDERGTSAVVTLPRDLEPSNFSMSPSGSQLAIQGRSAGGGDVIAVVLMPADNLALTPGSGSPLPRETAQPDRPERTREPAPVPTEDAQPEGSSEVATPGPEATADPTAVATVAASLPVADQSMDPTATAAAAQAVLAILDDVYSVGAPPAWSPDGTLLAFSAMPADRRHGPDVYVWRAGDERAQPLTDDHGSYFASWAGSRIVASRVAVAGDEVEVTTVAIDPETAEERSIAAADTWLPQVDPTGTHVVVWHGSLTWTEEGPEAASGALYLGPWSALDPFADPAVDGQPSPDSSASNSPDMPAGAESTASPEVDEEQGEADPAGSGEAPPDDHATPPSDSQGDGAAEDAKGPPRALPDGFVPVEPERDPVRAPVQDWQVRWSLDGLVLGYWIADVPGASWGELVVVPVDPETGELAADEPLLQPSLARRAFTLGLNRVAWVAPADDEPEGELRIRAWGPDGFGDLRLRPGQQQEQPPPAN